MHNASTHHPKYTIIDASICLTGLIASVCILLIELMLREPTSTADWVLAIVCAVLPGVLFFGAIRWYRNELLSRVDKEHDQERLNNLRILHNDVAGTLMYVIIRCRRDKSDSRFDADSSREFNKLEKLTEEALASLRNGVITPIVVETRKRMLAYEAQRTSENDVSK